MRRTVKRKQKMMEEERETSETLEKTMSEGKISDQVDDAKIITESSGLSKNQLKRLKRRELFEQIKEVKKQKRSAEMKGESRHEIVPRNESMFLERQERKKFKDTAFIEAATQNFHVVIDCSWEAEHTESTLKSLTQQIMFCYGCNKRHEKPAFLHLSHIGPKTLAQLEKNHLCSWLAVSTSSEDYLSNPLFSKEKVEGKKQLVYLTSDGEETLQALSPSEAYIIGGIVDRNRLKGITFEKAKAQGIRTAKLPIKEYMALTATHILTVNHVFEILLTFQQSQNWKETLDQVIPKRKEKPHHLHHSDQHSTGASSEIGNEKEEELQDEGK